MLLSNRTNSVITKIFAIVYDFLKGERASIGEIRTWSNGNQYKKTADGWILHSNPGYKNKSIHHLTKHQFEYHSKGTDSHIHKQQIERQMLVGHNIPVKILRDYPELCKKYSQYEKKVQVIDRINQLKQSLKKNGSGPEPVKKSPSDEIKQKIAESKNEFNRLRSELANTSWDESDKRKDLNEKLRLENINLSKLNEELEKSYKNYDPAAERDEREKNPAYLKEQIKKVEALIESSRNFSNILKDPEDKEFWLNTARVHENEKSRLESKLKPSSTTERTPEQKLDNAKLNIQIQLSHIREVKEIAEKHAKTLEEINKDTPTKSEVELWTILLDKIEPIKLSVGQIDKIESLKKQGKKSLIVSALADLSHNQKAIKFSNKLTREYELAKQNKLTGMISKLEYWLDVLTVKLAGYKLIDSIYPDVLRAKLTGGELSKAMNVL